MTVMERCAGSSLWRVACCRWSAVVAWEELVAVEGRCVSSAVTFVLSSSLLVVSCSSCVVRVATSVVSLAVLLVTSAVVCCVRSFRSVESLSSRCWVVTAVVAS